MINVERYARLVALFLDKHKEAVDAKLTLHITNGRFVRIRIEEEHSEESYVDGETSPVETGG